MELESLTQLLREARDGDSSAGNRAYELIYERLHHAARALAPLPRLLEMAAPYFAPTTLGLFLKGRDAAGEIEQAAQSWQFDCELKPSMTDDEARVVLLKALKPKREE